MHFPLLIFFGILPSIVWLLFFVRKDAHPESNRMVIKIFLCGMLAAVPAVLAEAGIINLLNELKLPLIFLTFLSAFVAIALIEEIFKYGVVKIKVLNHPELDEPVDVMLYMIIAALGFAAAENVLVLSSLEPNFLFKEMVAASILRFWGATFLHALCSGTLGYFLALSIFKARGKGITLIAGLVIAVLLHGLYNFSIMELAGSFSFLIPIIILTTLAGFLVLAFKNLKKMKSVCKI